MTNKEKAQIIGEVVLDTNEVERELAYTKANGPRPQKPALDTRRN